MLSLVLFVVSWDMIHGIGLSTSGLDWLYQIIKHHFRFLSVVLFVASWARGLYGMIPGGVV